MRDAGQDKCRMLDERETRQEEARTGRMQERRETGKPDIGKTRPDVYRTRYMLDRMDASICGRGWMLYMRKAGQDISWIGESGTGGMQEWRNAGRMKQDTRIAGMEGCRSRGVPERRDTGK